MELATLTPSCRSAKNTECHSGQEPIHEPEVCSLSRSDLERGVIAFLEQEVHHGKVDLGMDLREDLGIDGDDAELLLQQFCVAFEIDAQDFQCSEYFGPEAGFDPITWLVAKLLGWTGKLKPLTVRTLVDAAERGKFDRLP